MSSTKCVLVFLLYSCLLHLSCVSQHVPTRSCASVKNTPGASGSVVESFIPGDDLQCKLNQTCCSSQLEDTLMTNRKYKQRSLFLSSLLSSVDGCFAGGTFESSAAEVISSRETGLVNVISSTFGVHFNPHRNIFNDFYTYLAELPRTLDMCALREEVHNVLFKVYRATIVTASGNGLLVHQPEPYQTCLYNFFLKDKSTEIQRFYKIFEKSFARFWYFLRSRKIFIDVINELTRYFQFSDSCSMAILQASDCAACSGYSDVQVCNNYCINVFRGCLMEFKEVGIAYNSFYAALKSLENQMNTVFNPDTAFQSLHSGFLTFITSTAAVSTSVRDIPPIIITRIISQCGLIRQVATPAPDGIDKRDVTTEISLVQLATNQMKCFGNVHNLFNNIDAEMCEAYNATSSNTNCWNGKEIGSYDSEVLNTSRIDQQQNPEVDVPSSSSPVFTQLRQLLEVAARDIRYLLNEEICVADDEDTVCIQPDDYCNIPIVPEIEIEFSGSGIPPTNPIPTNITIPNVTDEPTGTTTTTSVTPSDDVTIPTFTRGSVTTPREWTSEPTTRDPDITTQPDPVNQDGGSTSTHLSFYVLLLTAVAAVLLW